MREEDLERVLDIVVKRQSIEQFAFTATPADLKENDYNLNIPRYVDTFEEEKTVDLAEISKLLISNEKATLKTNMDIAGFCTELGIDAPFEVK